MAYYRRYLEKLRPMYGRLQEPMEKAVFNYVCWAYIDFHEGRRKSKNVSKKELIKYLVNKGLMTMRTTKENELALPDDRKVREVARKLLRAGYPIVADSTSSGYYIVDSLEEIDKPQKENEKRAKMILAVGQGYNKVADLIRYDRSF